MNSAGPSGKTGPAEAAAELAPASARPSPAREARGNRYCRWTVITAAEIVKALGGYEPPEGTFSVGCVNHRGQGCSAVFPLGEAAELFEELKGMEADYALRIRATWKLLRKYIRRQRSHDAKALALAALSTALASPYCDLPSDFSATVRSHNRAARQQTPQYRASVTSCRHCQLLLLNG